MTEMIIAPSPAGPPAVGAWLGIDWADQSHRWAMQEAGAAARVEQGELEHSPEALEQFAVTLAARFPGQWIAVALEQSRGALWFALSKYAHLVLYPVHPNTLDHYRKSFYPSGAKSDPGDAALILDLLMKHPERLRRWAPDTLETRTLQFLVEARREIVDDKTRYLNRLTAQLKLYFPQLLSWFDVDQVVVGELLLRWPTLEQLQQARSSRVAQWLKQHGLSPARVAELQQAIAAGVAATRDAALIQAGCLAAQRLVGQLQLLRKSITAYDQRIAQLVGAHPDHALFQSLPGAGPVMVPRLIAAFGTQRQRFQSASEIQCYSGIAPVTAASGKQKWVHWRWACPKFLRQTFHEWANFSRRKSAWAKAYYHLQRQQGKSHHASVRALAFKWLRIVFRCWKDAKPYDEARYLQALQKHAKPVEISVNKIPGLTPIKDLFA